MLFGFAIFYVDLRSSLIGFNTFADTVITRDHSSDHKSNASDKVFTRGLFWRD